MNYDKNPQLITKLAEPIGANVADSSSQDCCEPERLTFLSELFGEKATASAMAEVMRTGHVGAEYVEYVLRHKRKLRPQGVAVHLNRPELDGLRFESPDLGVYDQLVPTRKTLDP